MRKPRSSYFQLVGAAMLCVGLLCWLYSWCIRGNRAICCGMYSVYLNDGFEGLLHYDYLVHELANAITLEYQPRVYPV